jgi:hypothetical protein
MAKEAKMRRSMLLVVTAAIPFAMGAKGGCAVNSMAPAPDVVGDWAIQYDPMMKVDVTIDGAAYSQLVPAAGGAVAITHKGQPFSFNIDCSRPEVVCPSEVWPSQVSIDQRDPSYPHRMWVQIPVQKCSGTEQPPPASECGAGTLNPDCKPVCSGTLTTTTADAFGVISDDGSSFDLLLGGTAATNGVNCALLGVSVAHATLESTGESTADWTATAMSDGTITTGYAGGCVWVDDSSSTNKALVVGATVVLSTPFSGARK